jgi:hypothetical protein
MKTSCDPQKYDLLPPWVSGATGWETLIYTFVFHILFPIQFFFDKFCRPVYFSAYGPTYKHKQRKIIYLNV